MGKEIIRNYKGEIIIGTIILGIVGIISIAGIVLLGIGDYYGSKYSGIKQEREKEALPKRLEYIEQHPNLDKLVITWIKMGIAVRGFSEEQVRIAENTWGEPEVKEGTNLPLGVDKVLIYHKAPEVKYEGGKSYCLIKDGILVGGYGLRSNEKFTKEKEELLLARYHKDLKIDIYLQAHPELDRKLFWEIKAGIGEIGLNKEQIIVVWDEPSEILKEGKDFQRKIYNYKDPKMKETIKGWSEFQADELWIYRNEKKKIYKKLYFKEDIVIDSGHIK